MKKYRAVSKGGKWRIVIQVPGGYRELNQEEVLHMVSRANQEENILQKAMSATHNIGRYGDLLDDLKGLR